MCSPSGHPSILPRERLIPLLKRRLDKHGWIVSVKVGCQLDFSERVVIAVGNQGATGWQFIRDDGNPLIHCIHMRHRP